MSSDNSEILKAIKSNKSETLQEISILMSKNTEVILEEIRKTNNKVQELEIKIEKLTEEKNLLEQKLSKQEKKVNEIEVLLKNKNIIIFGYEEDSNISYAEKENNILEFMKTQLEIDLKVNSIKKIRRIGVPKENKIQPLLISLNSERLKREILKSSKKLKGTG